MFIMLETIVNTVSLRDGHHGVGRTSCSGPGVGCARGAGRAARKPGLGGANCGGEWHGQQEPDGAEQGPHDLPYECLADQDDRDRPVRQVDERRTGSADPA